MLTQGNKTKGFTLIELLVVVAIISLLSSVVLSSLNSARAKSRNAARLSAIHTLINAFNLSLGSGSSFPSTGGVWVCVRATCYDGWAGYGANATVDTFLTPSLPQKPTDPVGGTRGYGGFLYGNPITPSGVSGAVSGAWLNYLMEPGGKCGPGINVAGPVNYVQCFFKLD